MIATRFREVVWTGGICAAALIFYMVSQSVAAKRAELARVDRKIAATNQEIRELRTEIDTRGGFAQLESWNQHVFGLQAPRAEQFVESSLRLAALVQPANRPELPLDPAIVATHGAVNQVSLNMIEDRAMAGPAPKATTISGSPSAALPVVRPANYVQARPSALAPTTPSPVHDVALRKPARTALDADFLAGIGEDSSAGHARKVKP